MTRKRLLPIIHCNWLKSAKPFYLLVFFLLLASPAQSQESPASIVFYYGPVDSVRELLSFDRVVVTPTQISDRQIAQLHKANIKVYGYLSVGEWDNSLGQVPGSSNVMTQNTAWNASVMDLRDNGWRNYLLSEAEALGNRGFDGLFLDTLDSYMLAPLSAAELDAQQVALIDMLDELSRSGSDDSEVELILNRGFELISRLSFQPAAVVAESMINGYDAAFDSYYQRTAADTQWVNDRLREVQQAGIEAIVIDYLPSERQEDRIAAAQQLLAMGFTPYLSNGMLTDVGVSTVYPVPRRVLVFFNGDQYLKKLPPCHRFLAVLIEYAGYVPDCFDVNQVSSLHFDPAKYAGVVYWLAQSNYTNTSLIALIERVLQTEGVRSLFIGELPDNRTLLERLHLQAADNYQGRLTTNLSQLGYRMPTSTLNVTPRYVLAPGALAAGAEVKVEITDAAGNSGVGLMETAWGGVVAEALTVQEMMGDRMRWSLDPFEDVLSLLHLPDIPVPDITTESGRRILTSHIDGDGFPSITYTGNRTFAGEIVRREILERYDIPQTVSVIEAEVAPHGLFPQYSAELEDIARKIFALDHVEIASHTFSHPFFWDERVAAAERVYGDSLEIPGYELDYDREVFGSVEYIERELIPAGSDKKVEVFLWSGSANPTPDVIAKTQELGIYNVNGGNTYVVNSNFSIAQIYPHLNWYPEAVQVYAPLMNENLYTDLWTDNYNGYSRAVESFQLLGEPRRLKPISIYYHMYSGIYPSSIRALRQVYDWSINQSVTPMFLSEYAARASTLYETGLARRVERSDSEASWEITSTGVRSIRLNDTRTVDGNSTGVAGVTDGPDGRYLTLADTRVTLSLQQDDSRDTLGGRPYLQSANGIIHQWQWQGQELLIEVQSHVPLSMTIAQHEQCQVSQSGAQLQTTGSGAVLTVASSSPGRHQLRLQCN